MRRLIASAKGQVRRRELLASLMATALGASTGQAQQQSNKIPRVGILTPAENEQTAVFEGFRQGLSELGYVEGRNIILEFRFARGDPAALPRLAVELANLPVDVIVTDGSGSLVQAAANAPRSIPIVIAASDADPLELGLAKSLAQPGGNVTGFSLMGRELSVKRLDLLRTAFPDATTLTVLVDPANFSAEGYFRATAEAAQALGLTPSRVEAASPEALATLAPQVLAQAGGLVIVLLDAMFWNQRRAILALVAAARVPAIYPEREYADDGGLMAYGPNVPDNFRRTAGYVDRILRGAKPGDLPIQQPVKFDFVVNLRTAKALGVTIPPSILARANEVIE